MLVNRLVAKPIFNVGNNFKARDNYKKSKLVGLLFFDKYLQNTIVCSLNQLPFLYNHHF
jgi:hypothetical protein